MTDNIHNTAIYTIQSKHHEQYQFLPRAKLCPCPSVCHVRVYVLRSLASSLSSSKTVLVHTEQAFWNGRYQLSFHQTCGSQQSRYERGWIQHLRRNSVVAQPAKSSWHWWTEAACLARHFEQSVVNHHRHDIIIFIKGWQTASSRPTNGGR